MHLSVALRRDLRALTDALDRPDADLPGLLAGLAASARLAVDSYLGLSLLSTSARRDIVLTVFEDDAEPSLARTSMYLALPPARAAAGSAVAGIVLYAGVRGAFVDLAADARWLGVTDVVRLDQHLPAPATTRSTVLEDRSTIDQALGVLLAGGEAPDDARATLAERACTEHVTELGAARGILAELEADPPPEG